MRELNKYCYYQRGTYKKDCQKLVTVRRLGCHVCKSFFGSGDYDIAIYAPNQDRYSNFLRGRFDTAEEAQTFLDRFAAQHDLKHAEA